MGKDNIKEIAKLLEHDAYRPLHSSSLPSLSSSSKKTKSITKPPTTKPQKEKKKIKKEKKEGETIDINPRMPGPQIIKRKKGDFEEGDIIDIPGDHHDLLGIIIIL